MNMQTDDSLLKAATKAMRIAVFVYVLVKQVFYMSLFESIYWLPRTYANIVMILVAFGLTYGNKLTKRQISWLVPLPLALTEIILVASFGGDRLTYIFLIGCALLSLLYMDTVGLYISTFVSCCAAAICIFACGFTLIGEDYEFADDVFNFAGLIVVDILICLIGKYGIGTLTAAKQDLENALRATQDASQAKSRFLATMSHEIRTPLNAILGITQIQMQKGNLSDEDARAFENINKSGNNLLGIINDILDLSKVETGKMELFPAEYDTARLINDAAQLSIVRIGVKPVKFILDIKEDLPAKLYGDELRLKQILSNLLSNAIKYTAQGYVKLTVSHSANLEDVILRFQVEDTGQGLKPEDRDRLFSEEYLRFNYKANHAVEGTGLGLSITKRLVDMMSGNIGVESEYGKGSIFTVMVRQKAVECNAIGAETAASLREFTYADSKSTRRMVSRTPMPYGSVLVVDDVESNLLVAEGLLAPYQLKIETTDSGFKALEKIKSGAVYDVIFMDQMMPGMDGIETTRELRALGYTGTIAALTANALVGNDEMFAQNGFDGFISKPIDILCLDETLNKFIRDKYPEEAKKYRPEAAPVKISATSGIDPKLNPKLKQVFCNDAQKAAVTLRETAGNGDLKLFTTAAHAMKSALANIGEPKMSEAAFALEKAGLDGDREFISQNAEDFIKNLENLTEKLRSNENIDDGAEIKEDGDFLREQLLKIKDACENYDETAAYQALDLLKEKSWKKETAARIEEIRDLLYLHSDFEGAANLAARLI